VRFPNGIELPRWDGMNGRSIGCRDLDCCAAMSRLRSDRGLLRRSLRRLDQRQERQQKRGTASAWRALAKWRGAAVRKGKTITRTRQRWNTRSSGSAR